MSATENTTVATELPKQEGFRVYVGNLSYSADEEKVREHITSVAGAPLSVNFPRRFGRPSGYAFANFEKEQDAKTAVEKLNDSEFNGRKLRVDEARPEASPEERKEKNAARKAKLAEAKKAKAASARAEATTGDEAAPAADAAADGEVKKARKPKRGSRRRQPAEEGEDTGADASDAQVTEAKPKAKRPAKKDTARIDGGEVEGAEKPKKERKPRERKFAPSGELSKDTLFVSNLPFEVDEEALSSVFTNLSISVKSSTILRSTFRSRKEGEAVQKRSRGFGFVVVENPAQLSEAVEKASGTLVSSRAINVKVANEMEPVEKAQVADAATPDKPAA